QRLPGFLRGAGMHGFEAAILERVHQSAGQRHVVLDDKEPHDLPSPSREPLSPFCRAILGLPVTPAARPRRRSRTIVARREPRMKRGTLRRWLHLGFTTASEHPGAGS